MTSIAASVVLGGVSFTSGLVYMASGVGGGVIFQGLYFVFKEGWPELQLGGLRQAVALGCTVIGSQLSFVMFFDRRNVVGPIPLLMVPFLLLASSLGTMALVFADQATLVALQRLLGVLLMITAFRMLYSTAVATRKRSFASLTALYALGGVQDEASELSEVEGLVLDEDAPENLQPNSGGEPNSQPGSPVPLLKARTVAQAGKTPSRQNLLQVAVGDDASHPTTGGHSAAQNHALGEASQTEAAPQIAMTSCLKAGTVVTGICSGLLGSVFGVAGPPLMIYVVQAGLLKHNIRGTVACCIGPSYLLSVIIFAASGYLTWDQLPTHGSNMASSFLGMTVGQAVHSRISQQQLTVCINALLLLISAQLTGGTGDSASAALSWTVALVGAGLVYAMGRYFSIHADSGADKVVGGRPARGVDTSTPPSVTQEDPIEAIV